MISRLQAQTLLEKHVQSPSLRRHCELVAQAMEAYAQKLGQDADTWYIAGLLHDLDWEEYPDEHPNMATNTLLPEAEVSEEIIDAIRAHAPDRTGKIPETLLEKHLFACDEISGFLDAVAKVRPEKFVGMKWSSVQKKLKTPQFAANVSREDITHGAELIGSSVEDHVTFLIGAFSQEK